MGFRIPQYTWYWEKVENAELKLQEIMEKMQLPARTIARWLHVVVKAEIIMVLPALQKKVEVIVSEVVTKEEPEMAVEEVFTAPQRHGNYHLFLPQWSSHHHGGHIGQVWRKSFLTKIPHFA